MEKDIKNSVAVYFADELINNEKKLAKQFSEGCKELEELLLFCWSNNVLTRGCCTGHRTKRYSLQDKTATGGHGYISFDIDNKEFAKQLSLNIFRNDFLKNVKSRKYDHIVVKNGELAISKWSNFKEGWFGISYYYPNTYSTKISGQVFAELKTCIKSALTNKLRPENKIEKFFCFMLDEIFDTKKNCNIYLNLLNMEFEKNHNLIRLKHLYQKQNNKEKNKAINEKIQEK